MDRFASSLGAAVAACFLGIGFARPANASPLQLASPAFAKGGPIASKYTCEGPGVSPPLAWQGVPSDAKSLVLVVDDPDAPDPSAPKTTWVHWLLYDIPVSARGLPEGVVRAALPPGTREGSNDWKRTGYGGPCPPVGRHRYVHKLYALDTMLGDLHAPDRRTLEAAMRGHVLAQAQLVGTYQKAGGR